MTHGLTPEGVRSASVSYAPFVGTIHVPLTAPLEERCRRYGFGDPGLVQVVKRNMAVYPA